MKLFISHTGRDALFAREIGRRLPKHMDVWIDERDLLSGSDLSQSIKSAINEEVDYVILLLSQNSIQSNWVSRELDWALKHEAKLGRVFVIPVLLDDVSDCLEPPEFRKRLYLKCFDQSESQVSTLINNLHQQIVKHVLTRIKAVAKRESELSGVISALSDMLSGMTADEKWLFSKIANHPAGRGLPLSELEREDHFHRTLRNLRDKNLIQPTERGIWQKDKHARLTEIGRALSRCDQFSELLVGDEQPVWWASEH